MNKENKETSLLTGLYKSVLSLNIAKTTLYLILAPSFSSALMLRISFSCVSRTPLFLLARNNWHTWFDSTMDWNEVTSHMVSKTSSFLGFFLVEGSRSHRVPLYLHLLLSVPLNLFLLKSRDRSVRFVCNTSFHEEMDWETRMWKRDIEMWRTKLAKLKNLSFYSLCRWSSCHADSNAGDLC